MSAEFDRAMNRLIADINVAIEDSLDEVAESIKTKAVNSTLFKGTGQLRRSIKVINEGPHRRSVIADTPYAGFVEFGNNQNGDFIYPKNGKVLTFQSGGGRVFATKIRAHGPIPFMTKAAEQTQEEALTIFSNHLSRVLG